MLIINNVCCLESGSTSHMCADYNKFKNPIKETSGVINLANYMSSTTKGKGKVDIIVDTGKYKRNLFKGRFVRSRLENEPEVSKIADIT